LQTPKKSGDGHSTDRYQLPESVNEMQHWRPGKKKTLPIADRTGLASGTATPVVDSKRDREPFSDPS
jgi:hypothetical protein